MSEVSASYSPSIALPEHPGMQFQEPANYSMSPLSSPSNVYPSMSTNSNFTTNMLPMNERPDFGDVVLSQTEPISHPVDFGINPTSSASPYQSGRQGNTFMNNGEDSFASYPSMPTYSHQQVSLPSFSALPSPQIHSSPQSALPNRYSSYNSPNMNNFSVPNLPSNPNSPFSDFYAGMGNMALPNSPWNYSINQPQSLLTPSSSEALREEEKSVPSIPGRRPAQEILSKARQAKPRRHFVIQKRPHEQQTEETESANEPSSDWETKSQIVVD